MSLSFHAIGGLRPVKKKNGSHLQTRAMRKLWMSVSVEDSQHMIEMLDVNHDDRVSMDVFRRFVYLLPESLVGCTTS